jgi:beta-1,4-mannosyl-glycoprotein beta-1,4-N-acetylglucosaminyltransferase
MYQDHEGKLHTFETCKTEFLTYLKTHKDSIKTEQKFNAQDLYIPQPKPEKKLPLKARVYKTIQTTRKRIKYKWDRIPLVGNRMMKIVEKNSKATWHTPEQIKEYRKKIKIYDIFSFFNELDLLEIRLNILDPYVDFFVLIESTKTFSGDTKPLHYQINKERYKKWNHKIIHYVIQDAPSSEDDLRARLHNTELSVLDRKIIKETLTTDNVDRSKNHWMREFYIKECIKKALVHLNDDDICYISDLDEIWNPDLLIDYSKDNIFKPILLPYAYYLNNRTNEHWEGWTGTIVTKYKNVKSSCLNHIRTHKKMREKYTYLLNGGWHFGFQGGYEGAKRKIIESNHFWYNSSETLPNLENRIRSNKDFRGRNIRLWKDEKNLPIFLQKNKEKYKKFFKQ